LAIFAAIRRALAGCTPGAAPHAKNRREHGTTPGEFGYDVSTAKASRQSPITVRLGTDSVNPAANIQISHQRCAKAKIGKAASL
jgi:hypothetical protein